jgi:hypothetical protein
LSLFFIASISGCKQEQLEQFAKQVQEQTIDKLPSSMDLPTPMKIISAGAFKLQVDKPIETTKANVRLIVIGDGRPNVLQLRSYQDLAADEFPAVLVQANTTATEISQLVGQTINATIYLSASKYEPIWSCLDQSMASLTVTSFQENTLKAELRCDKLISSQESTSPMSGSVEAVLQSPSVAQLEPAQTLDLPAGLPVDWMVQK